MSEQGHILVVDDNQINRIVLTRSLQGEGHMVLTAENGQQALEHLRTHTNAFDVILLDIMMPEMDGYQTLQALKADGDLRDLPVIMISGVDELNSVARCVEMGAADYIPKPFNAALLRALNTRLNALLDAKRLRERERNLFEQIERLRSAVAALQTDSFEPESLSDIASRPDALGTLTQEIVRLSRRA